MFAKLSQLHVNYRGASLSRHEDRSWFFRTRVRAGDRAPDVAFQLAGSGDTTTLFELLGAIRPVALIGATAAGDATRLGRLLETLRDFDVEPYILLSPDRRNAPTDAPCLFDLYGDFRRIYGMSGEFLCLIRPDDHVGLFQRPIDEARLANYLRMIGPEQESSSSPVQIANGTPALAS
jgi:hypothetical protein